MSTESLMTYEVVATTAELADGELKPIEVGGMSLVLCRDGDRYYATQRSCIHQGADLAAGQLADGAIVCPVHGWRFALATGAFELSPESCLRTYPVRVDGERILVGATPLPPASARG